MVDSLKHVHSPEGELRQTADTVSHPDLSLVGQKGDRLQQAAPGAKQESQDKSLDLGQDPKALGLLREAMERELFKQALLDFQQSPDKAAALKRLGPSFDKAVAGFDKSFNDVVKGVGGELQKLAKEQADVGKTAQDATKRADDIVKGIKNPQEQIVIRALASDYAKMSPGDPDAIRVADVLRNYPGLRETLDKVRGAGAKLDGIAARGDSLVGLAADALYDRVVARLVYSKVAGQGGDQAKSEQLRTEAELLRSQLPKDYGKQQNENGIQPIPTVPAFKRPSLQLL